MRIAFFDAKEYDIDFFNRANEEFGFELRFFAILSLSRLVFP